MEALNVLKREHAAIERVLALLAEAVSRAGAGRPVPRRFEPWVAEFLRYFADRCHRCKEEDALFPLLLRRGVPGAGRAVAVLVNGHARARDCLSRMESAAGRDRAAFARAAAEYAALMWQQMAREENGLFEAARRCLTGGDDAELLRRFRDVERRECDPALHERYCEEAERWAEAFGLWPGKG
ncbi:MAG TPA: hemerythrin domain-containing protein [Gemmataceae bacterium]